MHPFHPETVVLSMTLAHAETRTTPVPHWAVLLIGVIGLWITIGGGVIVLEWLLAQLSRR